MQLYVKDYCSHCSVCLENKASRQAKETLQPYKIEELQPRAAVAFDVAVLPWASYSHRYFLLIVDIFSKYVELAATKDQHATTIKDALRQSWVHRRGHSFVSRMHSLTQAFTYLRSIVSFQECIHLPKLFLYSAELFESTHTYLHK